MTLKIYDLLGQEVETLINDDYAAGKYRVRGNPWVWPRGHTFYRLQAGELHGEQEAVVVEVGEEWHQKLAIGGGHSRLPRTLPIASSPVSPLTQTGSPSRKTSTAVLFPSRCPRG